MKILLGVITIAFFGSLSAMDEGLSSSEESEQLCRKAISILFKEQHDRVFTNIAPLLIEKLEQSKREPKEVEIDIEKLVTDTVVDVLESKDREAQALHQKNNDAQRRTMIAALSNLGTAALTTVIFVILYILKD